MTSDADEPLEEFYGDDRVAEPRSDARRRHRPRPSPEKRTSMAGALMVGLALGLREVFEPKHQDRIAVEQPAPGQPLDPQRYEVHLDPSDPTSSFAIYRPWVEPADTDAGRPAPRTRRLGAVLRPGRPSTARNISRWRPMPAISNGSPPSALNPVPS